MSTPKQLFPAQMPCRRAAQLERVIAQAERDRSPALKSWIESMRHELAILTRRRFHAS